MADKQTYIFEVETKESGQRRKYGDTFREFIVENKSELNYGDYLIEKFCKSLIAEPVRFKDSPCHFDSVETFEKIEDRKFRYKQVIPSTH